MTVTRARFVVLATVVVVAAAAAGGMACSSTTAAKPAGSSMGDAGTSPEPVDASEPADASEAAAPEASTCLADDGDPLPDCDAISDAGAAGDAASSCIYTDFGRFACIGYHDNVKRGLARKAIDCVVALPASCGNGGGPPVHCARDLAPALCPDPTTADFCQPLVSYCADAGAQFGSMLQQQDCESYAALLNAAGRADFTSCIEGDPQGCSMVGLADCLGRIK